MSRASRTARRHALAAGVLAALLAAPAVRAQAPPAEPAPADAPPAPALLVPSGDFRYAPEGRRDPFKSLLALEQKKRDVNLLPPIQQFDLEAAKVVGVVVDPVRGAQAMIRSPGGQTFVLRKGTIVGKNDGEVVEITLAGVRVVEKFLDFMNRETRKETFLKSQSGAAK
jgi:type IV pilus assembly protein PilP